ncbi:MAG: 3-oxoacyl-[acyl-carrier-protein] synthase-3 [Myxococcota bacterium]|jgi:3-oxoacyl-[acyl-carrier-protein] synthase-3
MKVQSGTRPLLGLRVAGMGTLLPDTVRRNDWWPPDVVDRWKRDAADRNLMVRDAAAVDGPESDGVRRTLRAMAEVAGDPFHGVKSRPVLDGPTPTVEMEAIACRRACDDAGVDLSEVGLLIQHSTQPEDPTVPQATKLHHRLGMGLDCLSITVEAGANAFLHQLLLAAHLVSTGSVTHALIVQSNNYTQLIPPTEQYSTWFGDSATAMVLTQCSAESGLLAWTSHTDGQYYRTYTSNNPEAASSEGAAVTVENAGLMRQMLLSIADTFADSMTKTLAKAALAPTDVDFYASHQATVWFRAVTQEMMGLSEAASIDTCVDHGSLNACNIPLQLSLARDRGLLRPGSVVALAAGGAGITWTTLLLRWGALDG